MRPIIIGAVAGVLVVLGVIAARQAAESTIRSVPGRCTVCAASGVAWPPASSAPAEGTSLGVQIIGSLAIPAWAFVTMFGLFLALKTLGILRVSPEEEQDGLDIGEHGMHAYPAPLVVDSYSGSPPPVRLFAGRFAA